jgi:hypothetical protein
MLKFKWILLFLMLILAACQQQAAAVPTLASFPTATETPVATITQTPTNTLVPSFTPSPTLTPTLSRTPTNTPIPSVTPTKTITPLPTATHTPTATITPIPTRTPDPLSITVYQSDKQTPTYGEVVRLRWETNGETARIERLDSTGAVVETLAIEPIGSLQTTLPTEGAIVIYRLVATRGTEEVRSSISFSFQAVCTQTWFFNVTTDIGCPLSPPTGGQFTYQQFEQGFMFRLRSVGIDRVCGVQNSNNIATCFPYLGYTSTPTVTPIPNRFAPGDSFKNAFYVQLAIGGFWYNQIGWGTSQEITSSAQTQTSDRGIMYIQTPQGIIGIDQNLSGGQPIIRIQ